MKRIYLFLLLFFANSSFSATFIMALPDKDYPPFHFANGARPGIIADVVNSFAKRANINVEYALLPEVRSQKMLDEQLVDARIESINWYRGDGFYFWSDEIVKVEDVLVTAKKVALPNFDALHGYVFSGRFGYTYPSLEREIARGNLHRENFYDEVKMLNSIAHGEEKRFTILANASFNWYRNHHATFNDLKVSEVNIGVAPLQLQFPYTPRGQELAKQFNQFLIELKNSGELAKIINGYQ